MEAGIASSLLPSFLPPPFHPYLHGMLGTIYPPSYYIYYSIVHSAMPTTSNPLQVELGTFMAYLGAHIYLLRMTNYTTALCIRPCRPFAATSNPLQVGLGPNEAAVQRGEGRKRGPASHPSIHMYLNNIMCLHSICTYTHIYVHPYMWKPRYSPCRA